MRKSSALNVEIDGSEKQATFGYPVAIVIAYRAKLKKKSYLTQFWSKLPCSYTQIEVPNI